MIKGNISKINMRYIAKNLEIGTGTIYNYFDSKEDIFFEIAVDAWKSRVYSKIKNVSGNNIIQKFENILKIIRANCKPEEEIITLIDNSTKTDKGEKYYYLLILIKKMHNIVMDDLSKCVKDILDSENIIYDEFQCKMIVGFLRMSIMEDDIPSRKVAENLYKILT